MRTIDIRFMTLERAAQALVDDAPARGNYFGIAMRARYATTRPDDVLEQYQRTLRARALAYGGNIPRAMRERMRCDRCGATGCKMWREYQTFADHTEITCGPCALKINGKVGTIDAEGRVDEGDGIGKCDQIGWRVPAVPTFDGTFWGYTSVPAEGVAWWRALPSMPTEVP
jgi:hypothetical protein